VSLLLLFSRSAFVWTEAHDNIIVLKPTQQVDGSWSQRSPVCPALFDLANGKGRFLVYHLLSFPRIRAIPLRLPVWVCELAGHHQCSIECWQCLLYKRPSRSDRISWTLLLIGQFLMRYSLIIYFHKLSICMIEMSNDLTILKCRSYVRLGAHR
jgi:hypothetical protein